jgi:hypothetical protein
VSISSEAGWRKVEQLFTPPGRRLGVYQLQDRMPLRLTAMDTGKR